MENKKLIKSAGRIDLGLQLLQFVLLVLGLFVGLYSFSAVFSFDAPPYVHRLMLGGVQMTLAIPRTQFPDWPSYMDFDLLRLSRIMTWLAIPITTVVHWYCVKFLRQIIAPMKEGLPFQQGISRKLRKLAWIVLIGSGLTQVCDVLGNRFEMSSVDWNAVVNPEIVSKVSIFTTIDYNFLYVGLLFLFLSYVFRYGESLQQLADETL